MNSSAIDYSTVLASIPSGLRKPLLQQFSQIVKNFNEGRWEPAGLNGGKFSEVVYSILKGYVDGNFAARPTKPARMDQACRDLENADSSKFSRSIRVHIPRMLIALYEVRNQRSVGHVGGDVDPNHMDSVFVLYASKWIMAELVRIFHGIDTKSATNVVESLVERTIPLIWNVGVEKRVLDPNLKMREKTLVLLYETVGLVAENEIFRWVEHKNSTNYRTQVLLKLHLEKMIEYDKKNKTIRLSPLGVKYVEENIKLQI